MSQPKRKMTVLSLTQCTQHPQSGFSALRVTNEPTTLSPDLATFMLVVIVTLMTIMRI